MTGKEHKRTSGEAIISRGSGYVSVHLSKFRIGMFKTCISLSISSSIKEQNKY